MIISKSKWIALFIAVFLAIFQPFIHVHLDTQQPIQNTGFHVGDAHEEFVQPLSHSVDYPALTAIHASHTISVASGTIKDIQAELADESINFVLICLFFAFLFQIVVNFFSPSTSLFYQALKKLLPATRAPPQF